MGARIYRGVEYVGYCMWGLKCEIYQADAGFRISGVK